MAQRLLRLRQRLLAVSAHSRPGSAGERGFTFVEALVATAILTGGMVAVAQLLVLSLQMHHLGRSTSTASHLATAKVDQLMKLNFDSAAATRRRSNSKLEKNSKSILLSRELPRHE